VEEFLTTKDILQISTINISADISRKQKVWHKHTLLSTTQTSWMDTNIPLSSSPSSLLSLSSSSSSSSLSPSPLSTLSTSSSSSSSSSVSSLPLDASNWHMIAFAIRLTMCKKHQTRDSSPINVGRVWASFVVILSFADALSQTIERIWSGKAGEC